MQHSFDVKLAKDYGILEAILIQNIYFWIEKNKANNKHFYDGRYWTYNSKKAFSELFPYASERQIKYSLEKLIKAEILVTGSYNKQWSDRTLWYSFTNKGLSIIQKCQMHSTNLSNENRQNCPMTTDNNAQPIPYINTDKNTDNKQEKENNKLFSKESSKKIVKPSIEEIKDYCQERNNNVDAEQFYDYYESNGWKVGRNSMKDWKACIRTWEKNNRKVDKHFEQSKMESSYDSWGGIAQ